MAAFDRKVSHPLSPATAIAADRLPGAPSQRPPPVGAFRPASSSARTSSSVRSFPYPVRARRSTGSLAGAYFLLYVGYYTASQPFNPDVLATNLGLLTSTLQSMLSVVGAFGLIIDDEVRELRVRA